MFEIGAQPNDALAVRPLLSILGVAGGGEERAAVVADAAGRPYATACSARAPSRDGRRFVEANSHHPAMIVTAITEMSAIGNEQRAAHNRQRAALILNARREFHLERQQRSGDVHRVAGKDRAVLERQAEHEMLRT